MKVVCSWCRKEGKAEFVGEKAPLDDARETHGIASMKEIEHAVLEPSGNISVVPAT